MARGEGLSSASWDSQQGTTCWSWPQQSDTAMVAPACGMVLHLTISTIQYYTVLYSTIQY